MPTCHECEKTCEEELGRQVIVGQNSEGFDWIFLCLNCIRDWRQRGLKSEGYSRKVIQDILNKEYPMD